MPAGTRPSVVAFDVNETLVSLEPIRERLVAAGETAAALELFFARTLQHCFALAAMGTWRPFREVAQASLRLSTALDGDAIDHVLAAFGELPPQPDVEPAFTRLADAGVRIIALTHGPASTATAMFERTGLGRYVERVVSSESVRAFKPTAAAYLYACALCEVPPARMALVAAHAWDCHGARRAGLSTGWVSRLEGVCPDLHPAADAQGVTLLEVVDGLLALPSG
ncbi:MAG: HAD-IA family hydrolase [Geodermatophilaceae bacterium]|nr:HAD-IA family hydrolase [Geodermatophilaceae bacterium]